MNLVQPSRHSGPPAGARRHTSPLAHLSLYPPTVQQRPEAEQRTAQRLDAPTNYSARVTELLVPLGNEKAIHDTLSADPALRAELRQMAEDSLAPGAVVARMALNQYGGAHYAPVPWLADDSDGGTGQGRAAAPPTPARLELTPNPSTGQVQASYQLPASAGQVRLRVYDEWGRPQGEYPLEGDAATTHVTLHLRRGLYQCLLLADEQIVARERLLITP